MFNSHRTKSTENTKELFELRIQFYPSPELENSLTNEAKELGVNVSTLVNDLLNKHYGLIPATHLSYSELSKIIFKEIGDYVKSQEIVKEFELTEASDTYSNIAMVYSGKPSTTRGRISKVFINEYIDKIEPFKNIQQVKLANGNAKKSVGNRASLYEMKK